MGQQLPIEPPDSPRRAAVFGAALALACGISSGCETERSTIKTMGSFHIAGDGMYEGVQRWRDAATPEERAEIDKLIARKDVLIHIFLAEGRLSDLVSRGGASGWASDDMMKRVCDFHPIVATFARELNWDVVYDPRRAEEFEKQYGIPNSIEVILQHEFFGHVLLGLKDPKLAGMVAKNKQLKMANERQALDIENAYRRRRGYRVVPPELVFPR